MCSRAMTATMGKQEIKGRVRNAYWIFDAVRRSRFRCLCVYVIPEMLTFYEMTTIPSVARKCFQRLVHVIISVVHWAMLSDIRTFQR